MPEEVEVPPRETCCERYERETGANAGDCPADRHGEARENCEGCVQLRAELVEALRTVDTTDWSSYDGSTPRPLETVLKDIASRLEALGKKP